jgi:hypothetical protein
MPAALGPSVLQQPDIEYEPNIEKWRTRTRHRLGTEQLPQELPPGFPKKLVSDLVWQGDQLEGVYDWTYELNNAELDEIEQALAHFQCKPIVPMAHNADRTTSLRLV